jgi:PKD repeat protein
VDDYWIAYNNPGPDPFFVNSWTEHTYSDCTGDYMGTNQASLGNVDGGTTFFYYPDGSPLYNYTGSEPGARDGCHGLLDFYESRGYTVVHNYSQLIQGWNNNTDGYTFEQYKHEIDSGRVVLIHIVGHTMLGFGYDDETNLVYLHDTWDYNSHTMTWGGTYAGYAHNMVTVVKLAPSPDGVVANFSSSARRQLINNTVTFSDLTSGNPASWAWSLSPSTYTFVGGTTASSPNPQVQFTAPGLYAVTLTASNSGDSDSETKTNYIEAVSCSNFPLPVSEDFSEESLPLCWLNVDHIGNGQVWQFNNPGNWEINTTTASNGFAILDSDTYGDGNSQNADLVTPLLDFTGYTSINLRFEHYFRQWSVSSGTLSYSINGGSAWTVVQTWTSNTANAATFDQDMSAQVAGQANVKFKWNYVGAYEYYWAVDDISITGVRPGLWIGTGSSNWNTASNWSGSNVPGSTTNVTIPFISPNWPVYSGNLTVGTNCGNITLNGASQLTVTGSLTVPPGKQVNVNDNAVLNVEGMAE